MDSTRIHRISCDTGDADDFSMMRVTQSSGARWSRLCVQRMTTDGAGGVPDSYLTRHIVTVTPTVSTVRWHDGPTAELHGTPENEVVCVFPALQSYRASWDAPVTCTFLEFDPQLIDEAGRRGGSGGHVELRPGPLVADQLVAPLAKALVDLTLREDPSATLLAESLGATLALHVAQTSGVSFQLELEQRGALAPNKLRLLEEYVDANLHTGISLTDLATLVGMSIFHFARCFKQSVGQAPHRYVTHRRIERARHLLANPKFGVADVALRCGFAHQSHFSETFRRVVGTSPRTYRTALGLDTPH